MLTAERLEERRRGIGGSDIAAAIGLSPWRTPLDLYREKIGESEPEDLASNDAVHFGNVLEDVVAEEFSRRTGLKVRRSNQHHQHPDHDFLVANIDRAVVGKPLGMKCGLECKTADKWAARDKWGPGAVFGRDEAGELEILEADDQVPDWYLLQCVHYMAVTGADFWFLAVLIGGNDFRIYTIRRDPELEAIVIARAKAFWQNHVEARRPPEPVTLIDLETLYAQDNGAAVEACQDAIDTWAEIKELQAQAKALDARLDGQTVGRTKIGGLKNRLRAYIGEHAEILLGDEGKPLATWKTSKPRKVFDIDAFKAAHPKLHREYLVEKPGPRVLLIK
jgi:putative phage-type endonuclease